MWICMCMFTSFGDSHYRNWNYAFVIQQKSRARWQVSAPSAWGCIWANDFSFKVCVIQVVKNPHSCKELEASEDGQIHAPVVQECNQDLTCNNERSVSDQHCQWIHSDELIVLMNPIHPDRISCGTSVTVKWGSPLILGLFDPGVSYSQIQ